MIHAFLLVLLFYQYFNRWNQLIRPFQNEENCGKCLRIYLILSIMNGLEATNLSACWNWSPDNLLSQISILPEWIPRLLCDGVNRQHISCDLHSGTGGTHSHSLYLETKELLVLCKTLNIFLLVKFIPGRLNALADGLSRKHQLLPSEWTLHQEVTNQIFLMFGYPMVDLFATRHNHRLPLYVSPVYDPEACSVDAFLFDWDQLDAYAYLSFWFSKYWRKSGWVCVA